VAPVLPTVGLVLGLSSLKEALRAVFHQIRPWAIPIEAAVEGKWGMSRQYVVWLFCGHLLIDAVNVVLAGYGQRAVSAITQNIRIGVLQAMVQQDYEFFDRNAPGVLQERVNHDADMLGSELVRRPAEIVAQAITIICNMVGAKLQCSNRLFSTAMLPLLPVVVCQRRLLKYISTMNETEQRIGEQTASSASEVIREIRTVRQFGMERREVAQLVREGDVREEMSERVVIAAKMTDIVFSATIYGGLVTTLWMGTGDVAEGKMGVSQLLDVMFKLNFNVVFPMRTLLDQLPEVLRLRAPLGRICDLLESNPKIESTAADEMRLQAANAGQLTAILEACEDVVEGPFSEPRVVVKAKGVHYGAVPSGAQLIALATRDKEMPVHEKSCVQAEELSFPVTVCFSTKVRPTRFHGLIEFDDVHFAYPTNPQKPVLRGVSFTVQPGQKVALVGSTGCGKSSIMALLQRLFEPQRGSIKVDGRPIEDYDVRFLRSRMVIVDQSTVLFATTLRDNIIYGLDEEVDDKRLEQVCKDACAWSFIEGKPDHLMSEVSTRGANLSGGERQRVAIARAMVRNPDVILLDEATSALDTKNERVVQEALDKLAKQGSALVIAHRLSTIQDSDKIIVVDQGVNLEEGLHSDLIKKQPEKEEPIMRPVASPCRKCSGAGDLTVVSPRESGEAATMETLPGPPPVMERATSAPAVMAQGDPAVGLPQKVSYRELWESASGSEKMTVQQMQKRIDGLEEELTGLRGRMHKIRSYMSEALPSTTSRVMPVAYAA